jgi:rubrerythrin
MTQQEDKSVLALQMALQMETEGKEFYHMSGELSSNPLARQLFQQLAEQEDVHYARVLEIYNALTGKLGWPERETVPLNDKSIRHVFREAIESLGEDTSAAFGEMEAMKTAMQMEDRSYSFYRSRGEEAASPAEKSFYQALTAEERDHYLTLVDSYEYLSDPQGWFTRTEHWGLDGG